MLNNKVVVSLGRVGHRLSEASTFVSLCIFSDSFRAHSNGSSYGSCNYIDNSRKGLVPFVLLP